MPSVNAQFIMPVTPAGGQSWVLMKHSEGSPCDLFVTHGWSEGIYEFTDKVLNSWPPSWKWSARRQGHTEREGQAFAARAAP
mmetsp:Transcript_7233/g.17102  ORF Transcript_7233/g.17102 Transcript_7233/m.17102 type:complete len:82 (+) Transcript_7233:376-621(+)